ncbi:MAG: hypothetical protein AAFR61_31995 [Bacteroidota bacterium]
MNLQQATFARPFLYVLCVLGYLALGAAKPQDHEGEVLATVGQQVFTQADLSLYIRSLSFTLDHSLSPTEQQRVRSCLIKAFQQQPEKIRDEIWSLRTLEAFLQQQPSPKVLRQVRHDLRTSLRKFCEREGSHYFCLLQARYP